MKKSLNEPQKQKLDGTSAESSPDPVTLTIEGFDPSRSTEAIQLKLSVDVSKIIRKYHLRTEKIKQKGKIKLLEP